MTDIRLPKGILTEQNVVGVVMCLLNGKVFGAHVAVVKLAQDQKELVELQEEYNTRGYN